LSEAPRIEATPEGGGLVLRAAGAWTIDHAATLTPAVDALSTRSGTAGPITIDIAGIAHLDTYGAWMIERLLRMPASAGNAAKLAAVPDRYADLLEEVHRTDAITPAPPQRFFQPVEQLERIGRSAAGFVADLAELVAMTGALFLALARGVSRPRNFRLTSIVHHLDRVGWQAIGIILLITFLIGGIIAQQGIFNFRRFGAEDYVVDLVGILVLREIGVLIVAIMIAGRSGSSYTAELGAMKMREEVDALRTMGIDPVEVLVLPRVIALMIALPILTFLGSMAALVGGEMVAWFYGGMSPFAFLSRLRGAISVNDFEVGMIKAPVMAFIIGLVACTEGLKVQGSAESLGRQTTTSVVKAIFLVIVLDGLFAIFFASIGI
jgi:phospholipid/cholesterol/gamma-HCH transport system permease protein